jgi:hypothetical protein
LKSASEAIVFAKEVEKTDRGTAGAMTAIGRALLFADRLIEVNPETCDRTVIDISSDGRSNRGPDPTSISQAIALKGTTINALVIINQDESLLAYFQKYIAKGSGAFVQSANGYGDYARAIKQKILREITPTSAENLENPASPILLAQKY